MSSLWPSQVLMVPVYSADFNGFVSNDTLMVSLPTLFLILFKLVFNDVGNLCEPLFISGKVRLKCNEYMKNKNSRKHR